MKLLLNSFQTYILEGKLTIFSQAGNGLDFVNGFKGLNIDRDNIKVMFVNMCLYMSKGQADYVAIWDFDEFFIPKKPHKDLVDVINYAEYGPKADRDIIKLMMNSFGSVVNEEEWRDLLREKVYSNWGSITENIGGLADGDGHPLCYIIIDSETIGSNGDAIDVINRPWIGKD